ncbi:MAG: NAD-dependent succinate-semialdehyde dehydrogenase [Trueperaceae bacterium]
MSVPYTFKQLMNGQWTDAANKGTWQLIDPGSEDLIGEVPFGDATDARVAIDVASAAFPAWAAKTPYERAEVLLKAADWIAPRLDEIAKITTEESGKPLGEAKAEWLSASNYFKWFAGEGIRAYGRVIPARVHTRRLSVTHQPMGVIATITAWNFPVYNIVRTWAAALAAGCTIVGRPSEFTPRTGMLLAQALHEAGAPAGVINLINGDPASMAQELLNDVRVRKIAFTGSPRVGKLLMDGASRTMKKLALELGGNAPVLVFPDVDVSKVAQTAVTWKYRNCGQVCVAPQRFFVHERIYDEFAKLSAEVSAKLKVGHGLQGNDVGPLINAKQRERVEELVMASSSKGAKILTGGKRKEGKGYFFEPTVVTNVQPGVPVYDEEIFGPVMPIMSFSNTDEVLKHANDTEYGLAAFVMTNDLNTSIKMSEGLEYGMVCINDWLPATAEAPFGGIKGSGIGRETGSEGLLEYMETKTVFIGGVL